MDFRKHIAAVAAAGLLAAACGGGDEPNVPLATTGADDILYERGAELLEAGDWRSAREHFLQIRDNYPQSPLRAETRLGIGDSLIAEGSIESYISALSEFRDFLAQYPTHARAEYAQYRLGMVYFLQMRRAERDQAETRNAITEFELFLERYPQSPLRPEVEGSMRAARDRLSASYLVVADYYHGRKWYPGAIYRLEQILSEDPSFTGRDGVYFLLADSYRHTNREAEALELFEKLLAEFPQSEYVEDAQELLPEVRRSAQAAESVQAADSTQPSAAEAR